MKQTCTWVRFAFFVAWSVAVCALAVDKATSADCWEGPVTTASQTAAC